MSDERSSHPGDLTSFVTGEHYIVGDGETLDEIRRSGKWVAVENPVDVHR